MTALYRDRLGSDPALEKLILDDFQATVSAPHDIREHDLMPIIASCTAR